MGSESNLALLQERHELRQKQKVKRVRADGSNVLVLLQAARSLPELFHLEDLAVAAWKLDRERFGMRRWDFPDLNRVKAVVDGERGLVAREILERPFPNMLRLGPLAARRTEDPMPRS